MAWFFFSLSPALFASLSIFLRADFSTWFYVENVPDGDSLHFSLRTRLYRSLRNQLKLVTSGSLPFVAVAVGVFEAFFLWVFCFVLDVSGLLLVLPREMEFLWFVSSRLLVLSLRFVVWFS